MATNEHVDAGSSELSLGRDSRRGLLVRKACSRAEEARRAVYMHRSDASRPARKARSELPDPVGNAQALEALHRLCGSVRERVEGLGG